MCLLSKTTCNEIIFSCLLLARSAADAGCDIVTKEAVKFGLQGAVVVVEGMLLIRGELEFHLGHSFQVLIDVGEGPADVVEDFVEG